MRAEPAPALGDVPQIASPHPSPLSSSRGFFGSPPVQPRQRAAAGAGRRSGRLVTRCWPRRAVIGRSPRLSRRRRPAARRRRSTNPASSGPSGSRVSNCDCSSDGGHEVLSALHPRTQHVERCGEVHEHDLRRRVGAAQDLAVVPAQRRARQHAGDPGRVVVLQHLRQRLQPRPAVLVGQRRSGRHLVDVRGRMEGVALDVGHLEASRRGGFRPRSSRCRTPP